MIRDVINYNNDRFSLDRLTKGGKAMVEVKLDSQEETDKANAEIRFAAAAADGIIDRDEKQKRMVKWGFISLGAGAVVGIIIAVIFDRS